MKKMLTIMMLALWILPGQVMAQEVKTVTCVGDSNTINWYTRKIGNALGDGWNVVNCGKPGITMVGYHKTPNYTKAMESKPDYVAIMLGTNDAQGHIWSRRDPDTREQDFKDAYNKLIDDLQALESKPQVIVIVPIPVTPRFGPPGPKDKLRATQVSRKAGMEDIMPLIKEVAKERELPVLDFYELLKDEPKAVGDGVHANQTGYLMMADALAKKLKELDSK